MALDRISSASALLLLPPPPAASFEQCRNVYESLLSTVFTKLAELNGTNHAAILDIALFLPGLQSHTCQPRAKLFKSLQCLLANLYRLIGIVSVENNIELDAPGGINTRVILLDLDTVHPSGKDSSQASQIGPVLDLQTLATSARPWDRIYYPDNQVGQNLATAFSSIYSQFKDPNAGALHSIFGASNWTYSESIVAPDDSRGSQTNHSVIVGGTFDHFHIGHKLLLTAMALVLDPVRDTNPGTEALLTIGVTGDELLVNKKYAECLESWDERCEGVASFLTAIMDFYPPDKSATRTERVTQPGPNGKYIVMKVRSGLTLKLVQISDPFGPTITEEDISAIVVSQETRSGGAAVNEKRAEKGWKRLDVFEIDVLHSKDVPSSDFEDFASKISSTDIRRQRMEQAKNESS
ncbi:pantetheine-phosphate adenylyltransferase family protein [Aspergillus flavus]|nr:pantetheine-phosphate adenylyltransferase family protein [Aspergillus flavus]RAQ70758.1 pantetheine-phosphate adenylyltransferase family protein [Aspergillus flavus]